MTRHRITRRRSLALLLAAPAAFAADGPQVLSGGALEPAVEAALALWHGRGGAGAVTYATAPRIAERLAGGERPALVLAPAPFVEGLSRSGALAAPPVPLGAVAVGIALRDGAPVPDTATEDGLRDALLAADAVVFNRASTGLYVERLLDRLGLAERLAPRTVRFPDGDGVLRRLAAGTGREIAFAATTEILLFRGRGVRLLGPLPGAWRNSTSYAAGLLREHAGDEAARGLLTFLASAAARAAMAEAGVE